MSKKEKRHLALFDWDDDSRIPKGNITYILAFVIPAVIFLALYIMREIYPFGSNCFLRSDMYHQYAPFFAEFKNKLASGQSLSYAWDIGMGTNFSALYAYYLASPLNWFIFLCPQGAIIEVMNIFIVLKLCLASVALTHYLMRHFQTKTCTLAIFGMFYAMSAYVAAYNWNIMWLDCIWLLPLVMLGLERLVNSGKCLLYSISLGLCIFSNYYISIMVCLAVMIYYVVLMIAYDGERSLRTYAGKLLNFCIYSLLAGGIAAVVLLPEMYALSLSASSDINFPAKLSEYFPVLEMLVRQLINVPVHIGLEHYPNIYCGLGILLLIPLYVMNRDVPIREKAGKLFILLVFLLAFNLNIPNFVWHGLHFPNSLPARQSFIYIFFLLVMSFEAFRDVKRYERGQLTAAFWIPFLFLLVANQIFVGDVYNFKIFYISGGFLLFYGLLILLCRNEKFPVPALLFLFFAAAAVECTVNMAVTGLSITSRPAYTDDNAAVDTLVQLAEEHNSQQGAPAFFRTEKLFGSRTKNDGAWHGYRSLSVFSSMANAGVGDLLGKLGFQSSTNAYASKGATAVTYSLFSVRYLLSDCLVNTSDLIRYVGQQDNMYLYENPYTLPVAFGISEECEDFWLTDNNPFEAQNTFIQINTGIDNVFTRLPMHFNESYVEFSPGMRGHLYGYVNSGALDLLTATVNGNFSYSYTGLSKSYVVDLGYVDSSDTISLNGNAALNMDLYLLDQAAWKRAYEKLNREGLAVTGFGETRIEGTVTLDSSRQLMFSIPYDKGWTVKVDGKTVKTHPIKNAFLCIPLEKGTHEIVLTYAAVNQLSGLIITLISALTLLAIYYLQKPGFREKFKKNGGMLHETLGRTLHQGTQSTGL